MKFLSTLFLFVPFSLLSQLYFCNDDYCGVNKAKYGIYNQQLYKGNLFDESTVVLNYHQGVFYTKKSQSSFDIIVEYDEENNVVIKDRRNIFFIEENRIYFSEFNRYKYIYFTEDTIYLVLNNVESVLWSTFGNEYLTINEVISILLVTNF